MKRFFRAFGAASWLVLWGIPVTAATRAFFTSQESIEKELVDLIDDSHASMDIALFRFSSRPLAQAISRARARGTRIRIVIDGHKEADPESDDLKVALSLGEVRRLDGKQGGTQGIMHHKFMLIDQRRLVTGSFNWTAGAEHRNYENALLTDDLPVIKSYQQEFDRLWARATPMSPSSSANDSDPNGTRKKHDPWYNLKTRFTVKSAASKPPKAKKKRRKKRSS